MQTHFASNDALVAKHWSSRTWMQVRDQLFWTRTGMMGAGLDDAGSVVHYVNDFTNVPGRGTIVVMPLVEEMKEDGVVGDNLVEGNEEEITTDDQEMRLDQLRHSAISKGRFAEMQTVLRFRSQARDKLSNWGADRLDELHFLTVSGVAYTQRLNGTLRPDISQFPSLTFAADVVAPSTGRKVFAGDAVSTATLEAADVMDWFTILTAKAEAVYNRVKPLRKRGLNNYCVLMSAYQARDLKRDETYRQAVSQGGSRGDGNPLFAGSFANVDGCLLYEHNRVYNTLGAASGAKWGSAGTVDGAQALLLGAQALGFARIGDFTWDENEKVDAGNKSRIVFGGMFGLLKPQWLTQVDRGRVKEDFGVISIYTAASRTPPA